ncbi:MAG: glycosyltransferase family 39 protein, partial [Thermoanaerobaculia bacterium]|nr:glycosyltransferase family 39 protein [Thermoanaerobaculia bacterium]
LKPTRGFYPSPVFNLPPAVVVAALDRVADATGNEAWRARQGARFLAPTYVGLRWLQCVYSVAAVAVVFLVGRTLFSAWAGLIGAAMLAGMPWHVHSAGVFKPDALLSFTTLLAFWLSLLLFRRPRVALAILTGLAIALAMSAKMTGGLICVPLTVAMLVTARREPRRLGMLVVAGIASALFFVVLHPYWRAYPHYLANLSRDYEMRAGWQEWTRWQVPGRVLEFLVGPEVLGIGLGVVALAALVAAGVAVVRPSTLGADRRCELLMLVVFPLVYVLAYSLQTPYFKPNNFLPVVPMLVVVAAHALVSAGAWLAGRVPRLGAAALRGAAGAILALALLLPGSRYVYEAMVPTTLFAAEEFLVERQRQKPRWIVAEAVGVQEYRLFVGNLARLVVDDLLEVPAARLNLSDGEIFRSDRLDGPLERRYRSRMRRVGERHVAVFEPRLFRHRGPGLVAVRHRRHEIAPPQPLRLVSCGEGCWRQSGLGSGLVSFEVFVPESGEGPAPAPALAVAGRGVPLHLARSRRGVTSYFSERVRASADDGLEIRAMAGGGSPPSGRVYFWRLGPPGRSDRDEVGLGQAVQDRHVDEGEGDEGDDDQGEHDE